MTNNRKVISLHVDTYARLKARKHEGQSWDGVMRELLEEAEE